MGRKGRRHVSAAVVAFASTVLVVSSLVAAGPLEAQVLPPGPGPTLLPSSSTTTTIAASTTTTTATDTSSTTTTATTAPPADGASTTTAPPAADGTAADTGDGDGGSAGVAPGTVPPDAQRIIDAVVRTPPNSSQALYDAVGALVDLGLSRDDAIHAGFGRFPVAGVTHFGDDWLYPRYGPAPGQFRFHHGTDVFAAYGTPLRAVVDGTVTTSHNGLGGLTVKVHQADGTYYYYAHLSALVDGFTNGMPVRTGDIIGYVGDSGNAKGGAPHVHFAIYPHGGEPVDPKPVLDQFLADAMAQLPTIVEQVRARLSTPAPVVGLAPSRPLFDDTSQPAPRGADGDVPTEILYQASVNPSAGGTSMAETEAAQLAASIDWNTRRLDAEVARDLLRAHAGGAAGRARAPSRLVAEVLELERDVEVLLAEGGDDLLQRVALLARDPQLIALGLGLDPLHAQSLDELVELPGLVGRDPGRQADVLARPPAGGFLDLAGGRAP